MAFLPVLFSRGDWIGSWTDARLSGEGFNKIEAECCALIFILTISFSQTGFLQNLQNKKSPSMDGDFAFTF